MVQNRESEYIKKLKTEVIALRNKLNELADINGLVNRSISELRHRLDQLELRQAKLMDVSKPPPGPNPRRSGIFEVGDIVRVLTTRQANF